MGDMNDPPARNTGQHQCIANDVPSIPPSILLIYSFCVQPVFVYRLRFGLILRRPGIQRIQELVRAGGCGNRAFYHNVLCGNLFLIQDLVRTSIWTERGTCKGNPSKRPSGSRIAEDFGSRRDVGCHGSISTLWARCRGRIGTGFDFAA